MHIKRFEARDLQAALEQIRRELGADALILETRKASKGSGVEVLAARPHAGDSTELVPSGVRRSAALNAYRRLPNGAEPETEPEPIPAAPNRNGMPPAGRAQASPSSPGTRRTSTPPLDDAAVRRGLASLADLPSGRRGSGSSQDANDGEGPRSPRSGQSRHANEEGRLNARQLDEAARLIETLRAQIAAGTLPGSAADAPTSNGARTGDSLSNGVETSRSQSEPPVTSSHQNPPREPNEGGLAARLARVLSRAPRETNRVLPAKPSQKGSAEDDSRGRKAQTLPNENPADAEDTLRNEEFERAERSDAGWDDPSDHDALNAVARTGREEDRRSRNAREDQHQNDARADRRTADTRAEALGSDEEDQLRVRLAYLGRLVRSEHFSAIPLPFRELYLDLVDAEVDANLVFQILSRMGDAPLPGRFASAPPEEVVTMLARMVRTGGTIQADDPRRVIALVGPTGVGKTTTVAKIAGQVGFELQKRVALISTDSYRIFGAEHLASYAALMGVPFATASNSDEMRDLLEGRFAEEDVVLIDTSGRSPRDPAGIAEIQQLLEATPELEIQLVLAANGRARDLAFALDRFSVLPIRNLLFTKLDETTRRGGVFTLALKARRPVSYLGTGQEVPDDLCEATPETLLDGLFATEEARTNG